MEHVANKNSVSWRRTAPGNTARGRRLCDKLGFKAGVFNCYPPDSIDKWPKLCQWTAEFSVSVAVSDKTCDCLFRCQINLSFSYESLVLFTQSRAITLSISIRLYNLSRSLLSYSFRYTVLAELKYLRVIIKISYSNMRVSLLYNSLFLSEFFSLHYTYLTCFHHN